MLRYLTKPVTPLSSITFTVERVTCTAKLFTPFITLLKVSKSLGMSSVESLDMLHVLTVIRYAVGFYGDAASKIQVPAETEDAGYLVGSVAVGRIGGYDGYGEILVFVFIDGNGEIDGSCVH